MPEKPETFAQLLKRLREERGLFPASASDCGRYELRDPRQLRNEAQQPPPGSGEETREDTRGHRGTESVDSSKGTNNRAQMIGREVLGIMRKRAIEVPIYDQAPPAEPIDFGYLPRLGGLSEVKEPESYLLNTDEFAPDYYSGDIILVDHGEKPKEGDKVLAKMQGGKGKTLIGRYHMHNHPNGTVIGAKGRVPLEEPNELRGPIIGFYRTQPHGAQE